jgi:PAS domain S-box-containing protein
MIHPIFLLRGSLICGIRCVVAKSRTSIMIEKNNRPQKATGMRLKAEEKAREYSDLSLEKIKALSPEEIQQIFHELQVHQIELEMQHEELIRTQQELEASRDRFVNIYDLSPAGYLTLSEDGLIMDVNVTVANLLGAPINSLVKQPLTRFILPEDQDIFYQHRNNLNTAGQAQSCELRMAKKDAAPIWVILESNVVLDVDGKTLNRMVMRDVTKRRQAEDFLRETETKFQTVFELAPIGLILLDCQGVVLDCNQQLADIFGVLRKDYIGRNLPDSIPKGPVQQNLVDTIADNKNTCMKDHTNPFLVEKNYTSASPAKR